MKKSNERVLSGIYACSKENLYKIILCPLLLWGAAVPVFSQHEFTLGGEYRPRVEVRSGYSQPLSKELSPDLLMMQRVRLEAGYKYKELVRTKLTIQDSRVFGEADAKGEALNSNKKAPGVIIYEAWAELNFPKNISFRIGRQGLSYDDQRLLSVNNWSNTGNAHDLALLLFGYKNFKANLGYAYNNSQSNPLTSDYNYGTSSFYKTMAFLWLSQRFGDSGWKITAIAVSNGFQEAKKDEDGKEWYDNHYKYTYGGNLEFNKGGFPLGLYATYYGQSGHTNKGVKLNAYMWALKLNYNIIEPLNISAGTDYYSGTSRNSDSDETNTYTGLYGTNHAFNGAMDYWTASTLPKGGCVDLYLSLAYKVCEKVSLMGSYHNFRLARKVKEGPGMNLGHEIDLDVTYKFCKIATVKGGWSCYLKSDMTNIVRGVTGIDNPTANTETHFAQWAYVSLSVTPEFIFHKK